ncbi:hypothetical protein A2U01_0077543, partial [Trifolium medium]|nr:hypothetical protein [Trifolium medium]
CPELKDDDDSVHGGDASLGDGYEDAGALVVPRWESEERWVMDSECFYHVCSKKDYFETLELVEDGVVHLGDEKACKVQDMSSVCPTMFDN